MLFEQKQMQPALPWPSAKIEPEFFDIFSFSQLLILVSSKLPGSETRDAFPAGIADSDESVHHSGPVGQLSERSDALINNSSNAGKPHPHEHAVKRRKPEPKKAQQSLSDNFPP